MSSSKLNLGDITTELLSAIGKNHIAHKMISLAHSLGLLQVYRSPGRRKNIDEFFGDRFVIKQYPPEKRPAIKIERVHMLERMKHESFVDVDISVRHSGKEVFISLCRESFVGNDFFTDGRHLHYAELASDWILRELNIAVEIERLQEEYARAMMAARSIQQMQTF